MRGWAYCAIGWAMEAIMTAKTLDLCLQWPPSINGYWRSFRGRQIISVRGREYLEYIKGIVLEHNLKGYFGDAKLAVSIRMYPKTKRKFDCDNFTKCLFDSFSKCNLWHDDEQVYELHISKRKPMKNGFLEIHVQTIKGNE